MTLLVLDQCHLDQEKKYGGAYMVAVSRIVLCLAGTSV